MIQLQVLSGRHAGLVAQTRRFPFRIGRSPAMELCLDDDGVWEEHLTLTLDPQEGFGVNRHPDAFAAVNGAPFQRARLRNGDCLELGAVKIQFWLSNARQKNLAPRECLTWLFLALLALGQVVIIHRLTS